MSHVKLWNILVLSLLYVSPLRRERSHTVEVKIIANECNDSVTSAKKWRAVSVLLSRDIISNSRDISRGRPRFW
jgi:hypothetical protein